MGRVIQHTAGYICSCMYLGMDQISVYSAHALLWQSHAYKYKYKMELLCTRIIITKASISLVGGWVAGLPVSLCPLSVAVSVLCSDTWTYHCVINGIHKLLLI